MLILSSRQTQHNTTEHNRTQHKNRTHTFKIHNTTNNFFVNVFHPEVLWHINTNGSVNNRTLHFIYNKNSILSGRHVSTFIRSSSGPLRKQIQELSIRQWIVGSHNALKYWWICFPTGPEDELINVETCHPDNILFFIVYKIKSYWLTRLYL